MRSIKKQKRDVQSAVIACLVCFGFLHTVFSSSCQAEEPATAAQLEFFEKEVRPLLAQHCYSCHSVNAEKLKAGLLVDSRDALLAGGDSGPSIVPGDADASLLIEAVRYESYEMPPKGKLPDDQIRKLEKWVKMGAPWPVEAAPTAAQEREKFDIEQRKQEHWAWQQIQDPTVPPVADQSWPQDDLDRFILASLEEENLKPADDAERHALMRRLYFDLIGLPPTPEEAAEYLNDDSAGASAKLVDKLLASPHFGERWGRHWLDLVRYAESRGHEFDNDTPNAYQYRDYIIRAFNADVPYDQLVREHIAGDLLAEPRLNPESGFNESILGTGFWFLGEWVHSPVDIRKDESDRFDNMIDVMSKTFLGMTVSCARCHDHKFDAISTADYYSLSGFLQSSDFRQVRFESLEHNRRIANQLAAIESRYQKSVQLVLAQQGLVPPPTESIAKKKRGIVVDFSQLASGDYRQDGFIFGPDPRLSGEAWLETVDGSPHIRFATVSAAVNDPFWHGLESQSEPVRQDRSAISKIPRSGRTMRSPTFELTHGEVSCRVKGAGHIVACVDSHRLVAGPLHGKTVVPVKPEQNWVQLNLSRYVGHRVHLEFTPAPNTELEISVIAQGLSPAERRQIDRRAAELAEIISAFSTTAETKAGEELQRIAQEWASERAELGKQVQQRSRVAMAMLDGTGEDDRILIRGSSSNPGQVEPRHFLTAISGNQPMEIPFGSGRLQLAAEINGANNPLTSRVIVNRVWHYLMGRGIVPTTDDFGVLGQRPTHPALLDHLATRFDAEGKSIKQMIRTIVLSRTYQMSSQANKMALAADPKNTRWHYRPPKRLEGEAIRDTLLTLSGHLNDQQFGEPVPVHLTAFMDGRGRPGKSGPLDGAGRRSIYTAVRRNFLSPFMLAFDTPTPFSTMGRRTVSNVPAQALILMNNPLVVQETAAWAERAITLHAAPCERVAWLYQTAFARQPTAREMDVAEQFLQAQQQHRQTDPNDKQIWADYAHALVNTKEFIFLP